jgi:phospholipid-binding lipoprotein MlaA
VNSTVGAAGVFDVAASNGYKYNPADFGQTLGKWGVGHGAYLVVPLLGPSSLRDGTGLLVDSFGDPLTIYLHNIHEDGWTYARWGATFISSREELLDAVADLRKNSFDYYAAVRSAYFQHRQALLDGGKTASAAAPAGPADHP